MYKELLRPLLFRSDSEKIHELTLEVLKAVESYPPLCRFLNKIFEYRDPRLEVKLSGLTFKNPLGLAAGFDKNAEAVSVLSTLDFGHIEVGTVTPLPQEGNPRPRIFRLVEDKAAINRTGFPNQGVEKFCQNLAGVEKGDYVLGINIGKGKDTPIEKAAEDYAYLLEKVFPYADYIAVNVSSPNTIGLRQLQAKDHLTNLLSQVREKNLETARKRGVEPLPTLVKIAPYLTWAELEDILDVIRSGRADGLIATNTTIERPIFLRSPLRTQTGGLSGRPLRSRSTEIIAYAFRKTEGKLPIIGVGGVFNFEDVIEKLRAGANLVQVFTGLPFEGPFIVKKTNQALVAYMESLGISSITELRDT